MRPTLALLAALTAVAAAACGGHAGGNIPGSHVPDTQANRDILEVVENYRLALEDRKADVLQRMTSPHYWEDDGTAAGSDDWGYSKLGGDVRSRFLKARDIRYSLRYMNVERRCPHGHNGNEGCIALIDVLVDASFTVTNARGDEERRDMRDQNQLVLEWDKDDNSWKFVAGM
jgi:hypothetical protein